MKGKCYMDADQERGGVKNDCGVHRRTRSRAYMSIFQTYFNLILHVAAMVTYLQRVGAKLRWESREKLGCSLLYMGKEDSGGSTFVGEAG